MKFCMKIRRGWLVYVECVELVLISLTDSGHIFCMCIRSGRLDYVKMTASILLFFCFFFVFIRMDKINVARSAQNISIHEYFYVRVEDQ